MIANFCAALTATEGGGGKRGVVVITRMRYTKENTILSRPYTRVLVHSINGWSDIACPPSKHIFLSTQWPPLPFSRRKWVVHVPTFKRSVRIRSGFLVPRYFACISFNFIRYNVFSNYVNLKGITVSYILFRKLYFRFIFFFYFAFYSFFYTCNDR